MSRDRNPLLTGFALLFYLFLFAPILVLIVFSFNDSRRTFVWRGFTTEWYGRLLANDDLLSAVGVTLQVAVVAVLISTILGSLLGLGLARLRFRGHGATETLVLVPMVTPEIVMGLSLLLFFATLFDSRGSFAQLSVAHITFCVSFVAITVRSRATGLDPQLEEAARDLGASAWGAFRHVTLPLLAPGIAAGALLALSLSIDDYVVSAFNSGIGTTTLPLYIYSAIKFGVSPEINAISTIVVAITAVAILVAWRVGAFRTRERTVVASSETDDIPAEAGLRAIA
jgi:spermidine/putrescine transport system permease protein